MLFLSPLWLLALIPFAGLVVWSLVRRGATVDVPFVQLWRGEATSIQRRGARRPPLTVLLTLVAILLALLAAAAPALRGADRAGVTVIIDRGAAMSLDLRYRAAAEDAIKQLSAKGLAATVVTVPRLAGSIDRPVDVPPTAVDSRDALSDAVFELARRDMAIIVVTDQDLAAFSSHYVSRFAPAPPTDRLAIAHIAAKSSPATQVMVRLRNDSDTTTANITVASTTSQQVTVNLPPRGQTRDYFLDVPSVATNIAVSVGEQLGQQAWLASQAPRPHVEAVGPVSPSVERVIAAYARARPPSSMGRRIRVTASPTAVQGIGSIVLVGEGPSRPIVGRIEVHDHPLARDVDWRRLVEGSTVTGRPPTGYSPVVLAGITPLIATGPQNQVWVGLQVRGDAQSVDWVVLWTRIFDYLADGDAIVSEWSASSAQPLDENWRQIRGKSPNGTEPGLWPGLFGNAEGRLLAINAGEIVPNATATSTENWASQIVSQSVARTARPLAPFLLIAALLCVGVAVLCVTVRRGQGSRLTVP